MRRRILSINSIGRCCSIQRLAHTGFKNRLLKQKSIFKVLPTANVTIAVPVQPPTMYRHHFSPAFTATNPMMLLLQRPTIVPLCLYSDQSTQASKIDVCGKNRFLQGVRAASMTIAVWITKRPSIASWNFPISNQRNRSRIQNINVQCMSVPCITSIADHDEEFPATALHCVWVFKAKQIFL